MYVLDNIDKLYYRNVCTLKHDKAKKSLVYLFF